MRNSDKNFGVHLFPQDSSLTCHNETSIRSGLASAARFRSLRAELLPPQSSCQSLIRRSPKNQRSPVMGSETIEHQILKPLLLKICFMMCRWAVMPPPKGYTLYSIIYVGYRYHKMLGASKSLSQNATPKTAPPKKGLPLPLERIADFSSSDLTSDLTQNIVAPAARLVGSVFVRIGSNGCVSWNG